MTTTKSLSFCICLAATDRGRAAGGCPGSPAELERSRNTSSRASSTGSLPGRWACPLPPHLHAHAALHGRESAPRRPQAGQKITCSHAARQSKVPAFPRERCVWSPPARPGGMRVVGVQKADARASPRPPRPARCPLGWTMEGGKPVSPWAALGKAAWPAADAAGARSAARRAGRH